MLLKVFQQRLPLLAREKCQKWWNLLRREPEYLVLAAGSVAVSLALYSWFVGTAFICKNDSMRPTLCKNDIVWCWRWWAHRGNTLQRGDLVFSVNPKTNKYSNRRRTYVLGRVEGMKTARCVCCENEIISKVELSNSEDEKMEAKGGMVRYKVKFCLWPPSRFGYLGGQSQREEIPASLN